MRLLVVALALGVVLSVAGCGGRSSTGGSGPATHVTSVPTLDRGACRVQLARGSAIADRSRLSGMSLREFQLRSNDLQEVVEEATHVCPPAVTTRLKAASLLLLRTDDYLLGCAPARSCDPVRLRRALCGVERLEHRAEAAFRG